MNLKDLNWGYFSLSLVKSEAVLSFYIAKKSRLNNLHTIHIKTCEVLPEKDGRIELGSFDNLYDAKRKGKTFYERVKLCPYCCNVD